MTKVAITCIQLLRDLDSHRAPLDDLGWEIVTPEIVGQHLEGDALIEPLQGCVGVIAGDDKFTLEVQSALPDLKVISKWGIGIDGVDLESAANRGITVRNTPGMFDDEVADVTMAYIVMLMRQLVYVDRGIRAGGWPKPPGTSVRGLTVGIIGLGGIGRAVARRAMAAGMRPIGVDPSPVSQAEAVSIGVEIVEPAELLERSDAISVNCPLNSATHHLLDRDAFGRMKVGVFLVNTGRGPVVQTDALIEALSSGHLAGAALDVLEIEPTPADSPLREFDNVIFGSHNASNTLEASARTHQIAIAHLIEEIGRL
jgi:D-3-phosphoglycerate dehydrogenase